MLAIEKVTKHFGSRTLFEDLSFHFPEGERLALVGPNGAGKTTLLNLLTGLDAVDSGQILRSQSLRVGYLPQEPEQHPEASIILECLKGHAESFRLKKTMDRCLEELQSDSSPARVSAYETAESLFRQTGGYGLEAKASSILHGLGFTAQQLHKDPLQLSGGWRMRLELAKVFINEPDVMILDEPTNHLDLPSLMWVERYLQTFRGTLIFVSHDRALLNRLATQTILLSHGQIRCYPGNFDKLMEQKEAEEAQNEARKANLGKQREQLEEFVERFGAKASKARQAQSKAKQIDRLRELEEEIATPLSDSTLNLKLPEASPSGREVLKTQDLSIGYSKPLATQIQLQIEKGSRIAIIGSNGIGKSTFLKTIAGKLPALSGQIILGSNVKISYCSQNHEDVLNYQKTILDNLLYARADLGEREARQVLGSFLFSGESVYKEVRVLSGGEKARVALCRTIIDPSNFLLLDEPTNHLDMSSVEVLIEGLSQYQGTILFVSHDRRFIEALATHVFVMLPDGRSALFHGNLEDYQHLAQQTGFPNVLAPQLEKEGASASEKSTLKDSSRGEELAKQLKRDRSKLQKIIEKCEAEQVRLRSTTAKLELELADIDPQDYTRAQSLHSDLQKVQAELSNQEELWLNSAEDLALIESKLNDMGRLG